MDFIYVLGLLTWNTLKLSFSVGFLGLPSCTSPQKPTSRRSNCAFRTKRTCEAFEERSVLKGIKDISWLLMFMFIQILMLFLWLWDDRECRVFIADKLKFFIKSLGSRNIWHMVAIWSVLTLFAKIYVVLVSSFYPKSSLISCIHKMLHQFDCPSKTHLLGQSLLGQSPMITASSCRQLSHKARENGQRRGLPVGQKRAWLWVA